MGAKSLTLPVTKLYGEDFVAWASDTARLLREGRFDQIDIESLAEEIQAMADRDRRELRSRLRVLSFHLLKWRWQPKRRSRSWKSTIQEQRAAIEDLVQSSPSLRGSLRESVLRTYPKAVVRASIETGLPAASFPRECPWAVAEILGPDFLPES